VLPNGFVNRIAISGLMPDDEGGMYRILHGHRRLSPF